MAKHITIGYKPGKRNGQKGVTKIEAHEYHGSGCEAATKKYRDSLGKETYNERKEEYEEETFETEDSQEKETE